MLQSRIKSAASKCILKALCKKANSRKKMRAFITKLAADRLQEAYRFAPRGSTTQRMSPVPGAPGRESILRPSLAKQAFAGAKGSTGMSVAPPAPKAPAMPSAPKLTAGTKFFNPQNSNYAAMRGPDLARLAPKPQRQPGMSNQINYGTGPSGNQVTADIVPGGTMPVARPVGVTATKRPSDADYKSRQQAFNENTHAAREAAAAGQAAPGSPPLTQLLARMTPSQRRAYSRQLYDSPERYANRNQIAAQELARQDAANAPSAPEAAAIPIPEVEPEPVTPFATPIETAPEPQSLPIPSQSISQESTGNWRPPPKPNPLGLDATSMPNLNADPRDAVALAGNAAGQRLQQVVNPNYLFDLFSKIRAILPSFGNRVEDKDAPFSRMIQQQLEQADNDGFRSPRGTPLGDAAREQDQALFTL